MDIGFLVQLADGGRRNLAAPQGFRDVLYPAHGDASQIHLDEGFLHAALPTAIPLDDGGLEGHALKAGHVERDVAGGRGEFAVIVTAAVALTGLAALVAGRLRQRLRLFFQQFVQGFLHAAANQFLDLTLDNFLVQLYNFLGHSLLSPFRMVCGNFILPEPASYVFFYPLFNLRKLLYIIFSPNSLCCRNQKKHFDKAKERILRHPKYMLLKSNEMNEQKEIPQHLKKNNVKNQKEFSYYMPSAFLISQRLKV